jgi:predicted PurR-regulated permease PerM
VARASSIIISGTADHQVEPLWKKIAAGADHARAIRTLAWVGILVLFLWLTLNVDLIIFAGVLRRAADRMSGFTRIPVGVALPLVVLPVLAFLAGIGWFFAQAIANQIDQLTQQLPAAAAKVGTIVRQSSLGKIFMEHISSTSIMESPTTMLQKFFGVASIAVEVAGAIAVMLFLGLYFAADANLYMSGLLRLVPPAHRARGAEIWILRLMCCCSISAFI